MSLRVEYNHHIFEAEAGKNCSVNDFKNGIHLRINGYKDGGYVGVSNAKPEGEKNGPKYCEVGIPVKTNNSDTVNIVENFMSRDNKPFEIRIEGTSWKTRKR